MTTTQSSSFTAASSGDVKVTVLQEQVGEKDLQARGVYSHCAFETDFPDYLLSGNIYVLVSEAEHPYQPARIVDSNEPWLVTVYWYLTGSAAPLICGRDWRVKIFMESMGADNLDLEITQAGVPIPMNTSNFYGVQFYIPGNYVKVEANDGTPFAINVATALIANNGRPSPIVGFCSLDPILFFYEGIEV